jgi:glycosyltransferase involved in cell wall biosynthesis
VALSPPRVVHVSIADDVGGAARSAYKIHRGLRDAGVPSRMLVGQKLGDDADVRQFRGLAWRILDRPFRALTDATALQYLFAPSSWALLLHPWIRWAEIVQLYNLHGGYFSYPVVAPLSRWKTVVWRLSDMWSFTGHCAYSYECERWRTGCGSCPHLTEYPGLRRDRTAANWRIKRWLYGWSRLHFVAPSRWIERLARESPLIGRFPVTWIPNGVDTDRYRPRDRADARRRLGLPADGRIVLFGSTEARKGGALLAKALELVPPPAGTTVVTVGGDPSGDQTALRSVHLGRIRDEERMALVYAAADVFVQAALAENLPNTVLESFASGTPVVAFDVGGVADAVRHLETGYLARPADTADLGRGLALLLGDETLRSRLGARAREVALAEYTLDLQARRFAELYAELHG